VHWDEYFLREAALIAQKSKDPSTKCGAVIVRSDKTVASQGYNGFPRYIEDRYLADREYKLDRIIHAEMNALLFMREPMVWPPGNRSYTLYTWPFGPCCRCAVHMIQAGIARVVFPLNHVARWEDSFRAAKELFDEAGVEYVEDCRGGPGGNRYAPIGLGGGTEPDGST
jgi:dCMP deaminase